MTAGQKPSVLVTTLEVIAGRIDAFTSRVGRVVALLGFVTVLVCYATVYMRYAIGIGFTWTQELYIWTHVLLIMLGSSYTLMKGGFVRVDVFYARASERTRAWIDLFGAVFFTLPFIVTVAWFGWPFFFDSFAMRERSLYDDGLPALYLLKGSLLAFAALLLLQVVAEIFRNLAFLLGGTPLRRAPGIAA
jgi:TRAP-type mannitol/chloroaromatic compound transport system permease small subunit